ncbi:MAG: enoyl-CoA hydratase-related protein [Alphaproteobacteria bacterium]|nr:enoyl-CoA hydratase-related protein [Alphaproteobacteria bacterium]
MTEPCVTTTFEERGGGRVARVTLQNARRANCLSRALIIEIGDAFRALAPLEDLRAAILTGAGDRAFMAGADLAELGSADAAAGRDFITTLQHTHQAIRDLPVPVIARINGACMGAGLEMAASCDLRIASDNARFSMPEVLIDLPSVIEAALFPRLIGWGRTAWLLYRGDAIDAATAAEWGLVEKSVPLDALDAAVDELAETIAQNGPTGIRLQKSLMRDWERLPLDDGIRAGIEALTDAYRTGDPRGRIAAYRK